MKSNLKATWISSLGVALEYYDFVIYAMLASYLTPLFFPDSSSSLGTLKIFSIFAAGYIARPIGGLLFALIGDVKGRKPIFTAVMLMMTAATIAIGVMPTALDVGPMASLGLVLCRFIQGMSYGAELPGAITISSEFNNERQQGVGSGIVISSIAVGSIVANLFMTFFASYFTKQEILDFAWRIPFLLGGLMGFSIFIIRKFLPETAEFEQADDKAVAIMPLLKEVFANYRAVVFTGVVASLIGAAGVMVKLYVPSWLIQTEAYPADIVYRQLMFALTVSMVFSNLVGALLKRFTAQSLLIACATAIILLPYPAMKLIASQDNLNLFIGFCLFQFIVCSSQVSCLTWLGQIFPTKMRFSGIAICYNFAYCIGSVLPIIFALSVNDVDQTTMTVTMCLAAVGAFNLLVTTRMNLVKRNHEFKQQQLTS